MWYIDTVQAVQTFAAAVPAIDNPIDGIVPDFTVFGSEFNSWWKKLFGALWAGALIWAAVAFLIAIATAAQSKGGHPQELAESRKSAAVSGVVLAALAGFGIIVGAILAVAG